MRSQGFKVLRISGELNEDELCSSDQSFFALLKDILCKGSQCRFQAKGYSMSPFIRDGDVLTISPLPDSSPIIGDIVAFVHPETKKLTIHRIISRKGDSYIIKGDNANESDGLLRKENILGLVTGIERDGRKVFICLGPERFLIAFLNRRGLLFPLLLSLRRIIRPLVLIMYRVSRGLCILSHL